MSRTFSQALLLLFLQMFVLIAVAVSQPSQSVEWADGELIIEGVRIPLHHAYVQETIPGELKVTVSDVALDRALAKDEHDLMEQARAGKLSVLEILVSANGKGQVSSIIYDWRLRDANTGGPDIGKLKASLSTTLVDGTFIIPEQQTHYGQTIQASVRIHATGLTGKIRNLDDLLDSYPKVRRFLNDTSDRLLSVLGPVMIAAFFFLIISALLWALVIAPKRSQRILKQLDQYGYAIVDEKNPQLLAAIQKLGPYSLEGPIRPEFKEYERKMIGAARQKGVGHAYIVNVSQMYDSPGYHSSSSTIWQTLILEERSLPFQDDVYIRPRSWDNPLAAGRHTRFGLQEISSGHLESEFQRQFCVSTKEGRAVEIPPNLQKTLLSLAYYVVKPQGLKQAVLRKDLLWDANMKFCRDGWGICASNVWLQKQTVETLVKVGQSISESLRS